MFSRRYKSRCFSAWCYHFGNGSLVFGRESALPVAAGAILLVVGQTLNLGVFYRLGTVGVFYGNRFGRDLPWCDEFPLLDVEPSTVHRRLDFDLGFLYRYVLSAP